MTEHTRTILVAGATGTQGGAVLRHLHQDGWRLSALTRDATSARAQPLAALGTMAAGPWSSDPEQQPEQNHMARWFNTHGHQADIAALRQLHPGLLTLEGWARRNGWEHAEPLPLEALTWNGGAQ
jgi:nucleoside-diphosphate-sugar epimerase